VVAHRADRRNAPENSLKAIQNCIDMGVDIVELDIRMTKDSVLVLMHDEKVDRTTSGKGMVESYTLDSLKTLQLRSGNSFKTHYQVPTLDEVLKLC
jgi:glycerophosphoryl diester phosphodiesterase